MGKWFNQRNLPMTLIVIGVVANGLDVITAKETGGGALFGSDGFLKGLDESLPDYNVPGTDIRINTGGYLIAVGLIWMIIRELT